MENKKNILKNILLTLGLSTIVVAPLATIVSCGSSNNNNEDGNGDGNGGGGTTDPKPDQDTYLEIKDEKFSAIEGGLGGQFIINDPTLLSNDYKGYKHYKVFDIKKMLKDKISSLPNKDKISFEDKNGLIEYQVDFNIKNLQTKVVNLENENQYSLDKYNQDLKDLSKASVSFVFTWDKKRNDFDSFKQQIDSEFDDYFIYNNISGFKPVSSVDTKNNQVLISGYKFDISSLNAGLFSISGYGSGSELSQMFPEWFEKQTSESGEELSNPKPGKTFNFVFNNEGTNPDSGPSNGLFLWQSIEAISGSISVKKI